MIRLLAVAGAPYPFIAERYNVTPQAVGSVVREKTWRHSESDQGAMQQYWANMFSQQQAAKQRKSVRLIPSLARARDVIAQAVFLRSGHTLRSQNACKVRWAKHKAALVAHT